MIRLTISDKAGQQSNFDFQKTEVTVGRMTENDIVLPKGNVSKKHATIQANNGQFYITDHGSTNGSYINGQRINGQRHFGLDDKVIIGDFVIQVSQVSSANVPPPPPALPPLPAPDPGAASGGRAGFETLFDNPVGAGNNVRSTFVGPDEGGEDLRRTLDNIAMDAVDAMDLPEVSPQLGTPNYPNTPQGSTVAQPRPEPPVVGNSQDMPTPMPVQVEPLHAVVPLADPNLGQTSRPSLSALPEAVLVPKRIELVSSFDESFALAQLEAHSALIEEHDVSEWDMSYPATQEQKQQAIALAESAAQSTQESVDLEQLKRILVAELTSLGVLDLYLDDDNVQEVFVNGYDNITLKHGQRLEVAPYNFSSPDVLDKIAQRLIGHEEQGIHEIRFGDGTRVHLVMPPLSAQGPLITIRKPPAQLPSLEDMVQKSVLSQGMATFLRQSVESAQSILICGPSGSGKTAMLSALSQHIPEGVRIVSIEDDQQLKLSQRSAVRLETDVALNYDKTHLLRGALAMHPERIIMDSCQGQEAYPWVGAVASGASGSMTSVHGVSARDALEYIEQMCYLGIERANPRGLRGQVARAVDIVVVLNRSANDGFYIQQIANVQGVDFDAYRLRDVFYSMVEGDALHFHPTGYIPVFYERLQRGGVEVDLGIFQG